MEKPRSNKTRILVVEDDEDDYLILKGLFAKTAAPFKLHWVQDWGEAKKAISRRNHDAYLIDYRLGAHDGLELLAFAKPQKRLEPFIMLTSAGDERIEQQAVKLGAADYLVKGTFTADLLSRTLRYAVQRKHIEEQRVQHLIEITRAKDEFISLASHQLRTPATGVKQYIGMVLQGFAGEVSEVQRDMLEKAYASNERQLQIVTDLLKVAQVDAGQVKLRHSNVDLVQLLADVLKEQRDSFKNRLQSVYFHAPGSPAVVHVDADMLRMVFENIIDNAGKYSQTGKKIEVSIQQSATHYLVCIKDEGVGVAPEDQERLFQKFARIDNPLSTLVGGTGLGLYWAKRVVDLHGGDIVIDSEVGQGTAFTITLPKST